jgi:hypothetical protein
MSTIGFSLHAARGIAAALACVGLATGAAGDPAGAPLAPPGPCAEPRMDLRAAPDAGPLRPEAHRFDVAGSPRHHFTPQDVAAPVGDPGAAPPEPPGFTRGPCDAPNAGCGSLLDAAARGVKESPVQPGLPPGAGGRQP